MTLMTFEEMKSRYEEGEDSLDLALEKWERILKHSETVFHLSHFQEILQAAVVPIFLCEEYSRQCQKCPIFNICKQGRSEDWTTLIRIIQAYAIAGDLLSKELLFAQIELFNNKLKACKDEIYYTLN
jgi:hypothetical protein